MFAAYAAILCIDFCQYQSLSFFLSHLPLNQHWIDTAMPRVRLVECGPLVCAQTRPIGRAGTHLQWASTPTGLTGIRVLEGLGRWPLAHMTAQYRMTMNDLECISPLLDDFNLLISFESLALSGSLGQKNHPFICLCGKQWQSGMAQFASLRCLRQRVRVFSTTAIAPNRQRDKSLCFFEFQQNVSKVIQHFSGAELSRFFPYNLIYYNYI